MTVSALTPPTPAQVVRDASPTTVLAGFIAVLVGFTSSISLVFQAADRAHLTAAQTTSWLTAVYLAIAISGALLSWRYRAPVVTAWSTPALALIAQDAGQLTYPEFIGAYLVSAAIITLLGVTGLFERVTRRIPAPLASAMLAGILIPFVLGAFTALPRAPLTVGAMLLAFLIGRAFAARYAVLLALVAGVAAALLSGQVHFGVTSSVFGALTLTRPAFTVAGVLVLALPMTVLTLASQNLPGAAILRASGYSRVPTSPLITGTGLASLLSAPFGAHATNLAAITAAICTGPEAHADERRRYVAGLASACFYLLLAVFAGAVAAAVTAVPKPLVAALAGLALLGTVLSSLHAALADERWRESALITVVVTASGLTFLGLGAAFWGLALGGLSAALLNAARPKSPTEPS
ncbi:benzoate/H(+) symporter BenE family transporter [Deinococcus maricopensis]|uniref:Benzoate transporter n=1 Tax=Deinococcus maricopensis (strain DSM 21211 / LMG 22137 / NRRL B-23946 / LB-34) TaxID=709986 RepID=E8U7G7_DEIML|nr:benzoate/H(+) symporter BenE family transporter [Deinococcus maricopensis]ADV67006.1 benzoate transporter [Deinococcus maricopensis DSM 21211]